jgi:hypothetical protein
MKTTQIILIPTKYLEFRKGVATHLSKFQSLKPNLIDRNRSWCSCGTWLVIVHIWLVGFAEVSV